MDFKQRFSTEMFAALRDSLLLLYGALVESLSSHRWACWWGSAWLYMANFNFKWMDWQIAQIHITPPDLARRLKPGFCATSRRRRRSRSISWSRCSSAWSTSTRHVRPSGGACRVRRAARSNPGSNKARSNDTSH